MTYVPVPDLVRVQLAPEGPWADPSRSPVSVSCLPDDHGLTVVVEAHTVSRIQLRWHREVPTDALVLGDAWERTYGELAWKALRPEQLHPWMVVVHSPPPGRGEPVSTSAQAPSPHGRSTRPASRSGSIFVRVPTLCSSPDGS